MNHQRSDQMDGHKRVKFIETKPLYMDMVNELLDECRQVNQWANFGPLYDRLAREYCEHMNLGPGVTLAPCANAGVALEAVARVLAAGEGTDRLRWVGSSFSFKNLGRGYFADMQFLDCDAQGVLDFDTLEQTPPDTYDGVIVTNPFGMHVDFGRFIQFARTTGKKLIIDNAAGIDRRVPDWPWQVFSLHHTKPYGVGEGGLMLTPTEDAEFLRLLINYDKIPGRPEYWLNNGKISDISCAFLIARLRAVEQWQPAYMEQRDRIQALFGTFGLSSLLPTNGAPPTNSLPVLFGAPINDQKLTMPRVIDVARQYQPLAPTPCAQKTFEQMINFPTHPGLQDLTDTEIIRDIEVLLHARTT